MKGRIGVILMTLGVFLIVGALLLAVYNSIENNSAGKSADAILADIKEQIGTSPHNYNTDSFPIDESDSEKTDVPGVENISGPNPYDPAMSVYTKDEIDYIGYIYFPTLDLQLPVISEWSDSLMKLAPCRYAGSTKTDDLVLLGHNYTRHFGRLDRLVKGDKLFLYDMDGICYEYRVEGFEMLDSTAIEEMTAGEYDLTLFTCDYSGRNRLTVRCMKQR